MEMSSPPPLTPSKRPHDGESPTESNGKAKLQKSENQACNKLSSSSNAVFRVLCPASKIGNVAGESASQICPVKVRVEEAIPGCDERVVVLGPDGENDSNADCTQETDTKEESREKNDEATEEESAPTEDSESVTKALQLVFERIVEGDSVTDGGDEEGNKSLTCVCRLLVLSTQVGCILGKGGSVIKQMSSASGAQIRILPRDKLPLCVTGSDELVQISGEVDAVRKALASVAQQLLENLSRATDTSLANVTGPSSHTIDQPLPKLDVKSPPNRSQGASNSDLPGEDLHPAAHPQIPKPHGSGIPGRTRPSEELLTFRLLCHEERVGGVIGKGGTIIKTLKQETGCEIKVMDAVPDSDDRLIIISGHAHPDDRISAAQDAVIRVQNRIFRAAPNSKEQSMVAKLLVSSNQIGCLLGKGGAIINEMRNLSRAHIRVMGKDQIPKCASDDEELVQINGEFEAVKDALLHITTRLQHHFFRDAFPSINYPPNHAFMDQHPFQSYARRDFSPPRMLSSLGPSFHKFDALGGLPPHGGFHPHDDRAPFMHNFHRVGAPPHLSERRPWGPQALLEGGGPLGMPNFAGGPPRRIAGFGGTQPAIITNTTVQVVVPSTLVPVINGEDGECLKQIRQISDAKVTITEPKPGAAETVIIISGTPEQTHAAQSLIQAFVMCENDSS